MFCKIMSTCVSILLVAVLSSDASSEMYLHRILKQYQEKDIKTIQRRSPVELKATLIPRPERYENPKNWTTDSALRLIHLIRGNKTDASIQQALKNILASSLAGGSSGVKLRRTEEQSVIKIDNHLQLNLPSAKIDLKAIIDLILPKRTISWLKLFGSSNTSDIKGRDEVGNDGYSSAIKGSGRYGIGGSGGRGHYGIGGSGGHGHYGIGGSGEHGHYGIGGSGGHGHYGIGGSGGHGHYGIGGSSSSTSDESSVYGIGGSSDSAGDSSDFGIGSWADYDPVLDWILEHYGTSSSTGQPGTSSTSNPSIPTFGIFRNNYDNARKPGRTDNKIV